MIHYTFFITEAFLHLTISKGNIAIFSGQSDRGPYGGNVTVMAGVTNSYSSNGGVIEIIGGTTTNTDNYLGGDGGEA